MVWPEWSWEFINYVVSVGAAAGFLQLFYLLFFHIRIAASKGKLKNNTPVSPPVSIIICARNESINLSKNLPHILNQDYHKFEVIVVNDRSFDDSEHILEAFEKTHNNFRFINIDRGAKVAQGKKFALTVGIKGAKYKNVLLTDADCLPTGKKWISSMAEGYKKEPHIVIGFSPYQRRRGLLNKLIRFESTSVGLQYLAFAKSGVPYMGVGRNLGYHTDLFFQVSGFKSHYSIASGDDDLFIQEVADRKNTTVIYHKDSHIKTQPKTSWKSWWNQKTRHYTTSGRYRVFHKLLLAIYPFSWYLLVISFAILVFNKDWWIISIAFFALISVVKWIIWGIAFARLQARDLIIFLPFYEIIIQLITPVIFLTTTETHKKQWL